ncbi:MAG: FAD-dependent oxidoreductase [Deltaproteobacteria bacterium]|nr:FAD-dependent oxidoreductase [Deltaproteobacteria bacterium]
MNGEKERPGSESQLVVVGGGGAGLTAALAAAERGARVTVVEKRRVLGGNTNLAHVFFGVESPFHKRIGVEISRDAAFQMAMSYAHWKIDPKIVRSFIDKSGETVGWLEERGVEFFDIPNYYPEQNPRPYQFMKGHGTELCKILARHCRERGVEFVCKASARKILRDGDGNLAGVLVRTKEGELRVPGKAVVIATGGYAGNRRMLKKYFPYYSENLWLFGMPISVGDGLRLATEAGGASEGLGTLQLVGPRVPTSPYVSVAVVEPSTIWVNKKGERFVDESMAFRWPEAGNAVARQPDSLCWSIFDSATERSFIEDGIFRGYIKYPARTRLTELDREIAPEVEKGHVKISDSWDEIARWMGVDPAALKATVDGYNASCRAGRDGFFCKEPRFLRPLAQPPFYAVRCGLAFHGTLGGIRINHRMEVLDRKGEPVPGLYAAGTDTSGWEGDTYCLTLSGSTFAFAINSGRIAGESSSAYLVSRAVNSRVTMDTPNGGESAPVGQRWG